jgi:Outer membrane lipoprotein carrier protein LolA-like
VITGKRRWLVGGIACLFAHLSWSLDIQTVLNSATVSPPARVGFREERHNKMLKEALILTGYLEYLEAGRLRKVVESPFQEALLIDNDRIEIERDGKTRTLSLSKSRPLQTMLGGIEAILAGQTARVERVFNYQLSGTADDWSMQLTPHSRRISKHLTGLLVTGNSAAVTSIRIDLKDGEWHLMEIVKTDPDP